MNGLFMFSWLIATRENEGANGNVNFGKSFGISIYIIAWQFSNT